MYIRSIISEELGKRTVNLYRVACVKGVVKSVGHGQPFFVRRGVNLKHEFRRNVPVNIKATPHTSATQIQIKNNGVYHAADYILSQIPDENSEH